MVKVRTSQIPEDSPIISKQKKSSNWKSKSQQSEVDKFFDDMSEDFDDDDEKGYWRTMINLSAFGITLNIVDIRSIEKTFKLEESNYGGENITPMYGIIFNRGITSQSCPKTDIEIWYEKEEIRDQSYDKMMKILDAQGIKIVNI